MKDYFTISIILLLTVAIGGCSITPYQEESACKGMDDYGRCISIQDAYHEAVTGEFAGGIEINTDKNNQEIAESDSENMTDNHQSATDLPDFEKAARYSLIQRIVKPSDVPLLQPAKIYRVLVMPYQNDDGSIWYEPRDIYYIDRKPQWSTAVDTDAEADTESIELYQD